MNPILEGIFAALMAIIALILSALGFRTARKFLNKSKGEEECSKD